MLFMFRGKEPDYRIVQEPAEGHPEFLVAEINLPQVVSAPSEASVMTDLVDYTAQLHAVSVESGGCLKVNEKCFT